MRAPLCISIFLLLPIYSWSQSSSISNSWAEVKQNKKGTIIIYWYESTPFTWMSAGKMTGIEYELMMGFKQFIKNQHNIDLDIKRTEGKTFIDTYTTVRDSRDKGVFGAATFSITEGRKNEIGFSPPYMPDISILISSKNIPIVKNVDEFDKVFSKLKAITVKGTTYDEDLQSLKQERDIDFDIKYIPVDYVIQEVQKTNNAFGFITLPNYLTYMNKNAELSITRKNQYPKKR
jgi:hypothetical protein